MGSKDRVPPPGPGLMHHPDHFGPGVHPLPGPFQFDILSPPDVLGQKFAAPHFDMQRLAYENQRLAATHFALRQELASAQQELQRLQAHINAMKIDKEQQVKATVEKITKLETDLQDAEHVNQELQQAEAEAQGLVASRQELLTKAQQLTQNLQKSRADTHQMSDLVLDFEGLGQELQSCRATYDHEKKIRNDHLKSLQVMEKDYVSMSREMERLRAKLANNERSGSPYSGTTGYKDNDAFGDHTKGKTLYEDGYGIYQGRRTAGGGAVHLGGVAGPTAAGVGYKAGHGPSYDMQRGEHGYNAARGAGYDVVRGPSYDARRGHPGYVTARSDPGYETARGRPGFDVQRGPGYDAPLFRGPGSTQFAASPGNAAPYGTSVTPNRAVGVVYEASPRGTNTARRWP
ncbi:protein FLX-like 2 [Aristolochia californica]|uniref:protein FLX-like 2 n=1 Tax=Aristolochia californica TaxID=171875 RepID=UPI0035DBD329